ncbi:MAG: beta-propeller fold lactonase family protein [Candidatus Latescibacteria bacterium]|nr:beta-propeller fold lactonase family protein [Candidatus Latescibacterota bacterium]
MSYHMYVSNSGSNHLSHFLMDEETGGLAAQPDIDLGGAPGALATDAEQRWLFACMRSQQEFVTYAIDRSSGALTRVGGVSAGSAPYIYVDDTDSYLLATYYGEGAVSVHGIDGEGKLSTEPLQWIETAGHAHSIQTDRSNQFAFVPHTMPANAIYQFRFDAGSGQLTANDPPFIQPETPEGPRHFVFHPTKDLFYSVNEDGCTVSAHHFDAQKGTLSSFQVISTLPPGTDMEGMSTAEIKMTHDGQHLYASNRGHNTLAHFRVNDDGTLAEVDRYETEAVPRFFDIDPTGRFVYSAGQNTGRLASYRIGDGGGLEPMVAYEVGETPLWIQFVKQI